MKKLLLLPLFLLTGCATMQEACPQDQERVCDVRYEPAYNKILKMMIPTPIYSNCRCEPKI